MSLKYQVVPVTSFAQNCSIVWCDETMEGIVVDPGGDVQQLAAIIEELGVKVVNLVLTHGHLDHVGGTVPLAEILKVNIVGPHKADNFWLQGLENQSQMFGFPLCKAFEPNTWLEEGDKVTFGNQVIDVIHTPGHTPGHVVLFSEQARIAFVGDVLFNGAIGRTDFPQGDFNTLIASIKTKLWPLGSDVTFVPGHGPESTFGRERASNPFVADEMPLY
ncbi:MBL fold metallo-hydrolase [Vibrio crassostreae]|uniref:Metallo-hydrolase/oxidoreductase n=1 Tax=Vibrio crassostreae TaxID=246167 RepID=A0ABP1X0H3_9VIBR|nr:MBL fold metallo-hydrolase [Vibrio crassostreae]ROO64532.1 glyoxylase-like metal-dependent hydrolase (beta-lactamase superfamily II) [Vibrio crassostreae]ROO74929.1 glyoxylase-like metal-dependent hydrolase (beta-lactamase superfamily II) [Vibrio crassostreae]ROR86063.1 glyoxylase-like metal-dependent hydrolase (beta-lactamase superfamily II) [Vibrio crassostreae]ROS63244.1 glyoxylase-like metal-dependent hydrolase (beta-lactamase superfamily II) [Vibrio crassostreae]RPF58925.1 glyoxylase-l